MNKKYSKEILTVLIIIDLMATYYLYSKNETHFAIICIGVFAILLGMLIYSVATTKNEKEIFFTSVNRIEKAYSGILVESSIPNLKDKDIIYVKDIENLVNAAIQMKKPVFFVKDIESCAYIVLDNNNALVNIFKVNKKSDNRVENLINEMHGIFRDDIFGDEQIEDAVFDKNLQKDDAFADKTKKKNGKKEKNKELIEDDAFADKTRDDAFADRTKKRKAKEEALTKDDAFADKTRDDAFKDRSKKKEEPKKEEVKKADNKKVEEVPDTEVKKKKKKKKKKNKNNNSN